MYLLLCLGKPNYFKLPNFSDNKDSSHRAYSKQYCYKPLLDTTIPAKSTKVQDSWTELIQLPSDVLATQPGNKLSEAINGVASHWLCSLPEI